MANGSFEADIELDDEVDQFEITNFPWYKASRVLMPKQDAPKRMSTEADLRAQGRCPKCTELLPMTWMGLGECERCGVDGN
jgi:hypothetical protein